MMIVRSEVKIVTDDQLNRSDHAVTSENCSFGDWLPALAGTNNFDAKKLQLASCGKLERRRCIKLRLDMVLSSSDLAAEL